MSYFSEGPEGRDTEYCEPHDEVKSDCAKCIKAELAAAKSRIAELEREPRHLGLMDLVERCEKAEATIKERDKTIAELNQAWLTEIQKKDRLLALALGKLESLTQQFTRKMSIGSSDNILGARVYREEIEECRKFLADQSKEK